MSPSVHGLTREDPPVFRVLARGDLGGLRALLQAEPRAVRSRMGSHGQSPLHVAVELRRWDLCEALLRAGARIDAKDLAGQTALHLAAARGEERCVRGLLRHGARPGIAASGRITPLHLAARHAGPGAVRALLDAGAKVDARSYNGATPAIMACHGGRLDTVRVLAAHGAELVRARQALNAGGPFAHCLDIAAGERQRELVRFLLTRTWPAPLLNVALGFATLRAQGAICRDLVAEGADPFEPAGKSRKSAWQLAREKRLGAILRYFDSLRSGAVPRREAATRAPRGRT